MCHVPIYCYLLQFYSTVQLELLNKTVKRKACLVAYQKIAAQIAKQLAQMIHKTTWTDSDA